MTYTTTLNALRVHNTPRDSWQKLLKHLGKVRSDDEPLSIQTILESNGLDDALFYLRGLSAKHDAAIRLLLCNIVEPVLAFTDDPRPGKTIETVRWYALGEVTEEELAAARDAAMDAADVAWGAPKAVARAASLAAFGSAGKTAFDVVVLVNAAYAARAGTRPADLAEQELIFYQWLEKVFRLWLEGSYTRVQPPVYINRENDT